jgi:hypothetical protein
MSSLMFGFGTPYDRNKPYDRSIQAIPTPGHETIASLMLARWPFVR